MWLIVYREPQEISGDKLASYLGFPGELHMSDTPGTCPAQISEPVIFSHCHRIKYLGFHRETHLESSPKRFIALQRYIDKKLKWTSLSVLLLYISAHCIRIYWFWLDNRRQKVKLVSALFEILLQIDLPLCKSTRDHHWAPRSRSLPWHLRKVETYQPSSGCDPHHTADEFRQVLPNQWMVKIFPRQISWIARRCLRSFLFCKDSSKEKIVNRKPPSLPPEMRQINCHSRAGGLKSCFCQNTS